MSIVLGVLGTINAVCKAISDICALLASPEGQAQMAMWRADKAMFYAAVAAVLDRVKLTAEWVLTLNTASADRPAVLEAIFGAKTK